jgi:hypothetical protein
VQMKQLACFLLLVSLLGCMSSPPQDVYFPKDSLNNELAKSTSELLEKIGERPLWERPTSLVEPQFTCRLIVIPSANYRACITVEKLRSGDCVLTTKLFESGSSTLSSFGIRRSVSEGLAFSESRILSTEDWHVFWRGIEDLSRLAPEVVPPGLNNVFSELDGTTFVIEVRKLDTYQLFLVSDPMQKPFTDEARKMLLNMFPGLDVDELEKYIQKYGEMLKWFGKKTQIDILNRYSAEPTSEVLTSPSNAPPPPTNPPADGKR